ncbi:MAG: ATPase with chaperone activity [Rhodoferax sp.]|nr:ATPase with chaperone activity [Rhodoferax sp.]
MSDDNQVEIPQSFIALFMEPGRSKLAATRFFIAQRYELCEDMASMLTQTAQEMLHGLGITERDVLQRCFQGLTTGEPVCTPAEAQWVVCRLAELSQWPQPGDFPKLQP